MRHRILPCVQYWSVLRYLRGVSLSAKGGAEHNPMERSGADAHRYCRTRSDALLHSVISNRRASSPQISLLFVSGRFRHNGGSEHEEAHRDKQRHSVETQNRDCRVSGVLLPVPSLQPGFLQAPKHGARTLWPRDFSRRRGCSVLVRASPSTRASRSNARRAHKLTCNNSFLFSCLQADSRRCAPGLR